MRRTAASPIRPSVWTAVVVFAASLGYAMLRYAVYRGVPLSRLPLYLNNKALAVAAVALIAIAYAMGPLARFFPSAIVPRLDMRKWIGLFGFGLASLHALASLILFSPASYPKFFETNGQLNLVGELSMLFGVLGFAVFAIVAVLSVPSVARDVPEETWLRVQRSGYLGLLLVLGHVFVMGYEGWGNPATWPGGLLPMSLVAFIIGAAALLLRLLVLMLPKRPRKR